MDTEVRVVDGKVHGDKLARLGSMVLFCTHGKTYRSKEERKPRHGLDGVRN